MWYPGLVIINRYNRSADGYLPAWIIVNSFCPTSTARLACAPRRYGESKKSHLKVLLVLFFRHIDAALPQSRTQRSIPRWLVRETSMRRLVQIRIRRKLSLVDRWNVETNSGCVLRTSSVCFRPRVPRHFTDVTETYAGDGPSKQYYFFGKIEWSTRTQMRKSRCETSERTPESQKLPETKVFKPGRFVLLCPR